MIISRLTELLHSLGLPCSSSHVWITTLSYLLYRVITSDHDLGVWFAVLRYPSWRLRKYYTGKVIWITGASSGLGRGLAVELSQYPCKLVISARREEELKLVKSECVERGAAPDNILVLPLDSLKFPALPGAVTRVIAQFGTIDILVNNAGRSQRSLAEATDISVDRAMMELNYLGYVALTKAVLPTMVTNEAGTIVAISSITGKMGAPVSSAYAASKHAVNGFFDSLRLELFSYGIDVCVVCPGPVKSDISLSSFTEDLTKSYNQDMSKVGRKQETDRFAVLMSISLAARLPESWISIQPYLTFLYVAQYLPGVVKGYLGCVAAQGRIKKFKNKECLY